MFLNESVLNENSIMRDVTPFIYENYNMLVEYMESTDMELVLESEDDEKILKDIESYRDKVKKELEVKIDESNARARKTAIHALINFGLSLIAVALISFASEVVAISLIIASLLGTMYIIIRLSSDGKKLLKDIEYLKDLKKKTERLADKAKDDKTRYALDSLADKIEITIMKLEKQYDRTRQ